MTASRRSISLSVAGLVLAALAVYANSFAGPFIFDDLPSIPQNPTLANLLSSLDPPGGGLTVTGRPFLNLSFAVNHAIGGDHVGGYHAVNLLIHLLAGVTLFGIVRRTRAASASRQPPGDWPLVAFAAALLWTLHPLQTESVTYLVQRAESLMGLLYLLTLYFFIRHAELSAIGDSEGDARRGTSSGVNSRRGVYAVLSVLACGLGMATKEVMVTAPLIVLLYDRTFLAGSFRAAIRRRAWTYLALAATWIPLGGLVLHAANRGGTAGFGIGVGFWTYEASQFQALLRYLRLAVWPNPLIIDYGVEWPRSIAEVTPGAVAFAALAAGTVLALFRRPGLGFLGVTFFAILAPTSLVPGNRQTIAEHRMYLALAPMIVLGVLGCRAWMPRRWTLVVGAFAVVLGFLTVQRNADYRSDLAIWRKTVNLRPGNAAAHNNYGNILAQSGQPEGAVVQYDEAIRLNPNYGDAYYNAGRTLARLGRIPDAIARLEEAVRLRPNDTEARYGLAICLLIAGRTEDAVAQLEAALRLNPGLGQAHVKLAQALATLGRSGEASAHLEAAQRLGAAIPGMGR